MQAALFVVLGIFPLQKGPSESKGLHKDEEVDRSHLLSEKRDQASKGRRLDIVRLQEFPDLSRSYCCSCVRLPHITAA